MRHLKEGQGWRLGWNPDAITFKGLVGGDRWATEMTKPEFDDFCRLSTQLAEQETLHIWVSAEGFPHQYSLQFILLQGRGVEGRWPATVVPDLIQAIQAIKVF